MKKRLLIMVTLLVVMCAHQTAWVAAVNQKTVVNVKEKNAKVIRFSTLYVGEVVLDAEQSFIYLYSEDLTNSAVMFSAVRYGLSDFKDGKYITLVPDMIGESEDKGIAVCSNSDYLSKMNSDWKDAYKAGQACLANTTVGSSSSENLYETDATFAAKCGAISDEEDVSYYDEAGNDFTSSGILGKLSATNTDNVTYTVEDGVLVKYIERYIDYTCEMITVIYTKVELESDASGISIVHSEDENAVSANWCALDGRRINGKPAQKGIYVSNGRKIALE